MDCVCQLRMNDIRRCYCTGGYRGDGEVCEKPPKDCQEIYEDGTSDNGIYRIEPTGWTGEAFEVYCNMTDGGGWTVSQRRVDGTEYFFLEWNSYKQGFGSLDHDFWLGNDKLYYLTNQKRYKIRIDLVSKEGAPYYAKFDFFRINDESDNYRLSGVENLQVEPQVVNLGFISFFFKSGSCCKIIKKPNTCSQLHAHIINYRNSFDPTRFSYQRPWGLYVKWWHRGTQISQMQLTA
ncbi:putative fibrinogen-like protein 1 [Apostichopus japonicus]|uniref:Putative fibrinogen-like protein 1 n=1 Tax=Stichopus japonicus TaxID=307972 RepID=A0A2G8LE04_STIJA|nr:putative fibrinogen-like protein 1 [Apostichopus japonicus]